MESLQKRKRESGYCENKNDEWGPCRRWLLLLAKREEEKWGKETLLRRRHILNPFDRAGHGVT